MASDVITPHPYQRRGIDYTWKWLSENDGNLCLISPTGSGKSVIVAFLCKEAVQGWPETKILMLVAQKELLEQNSDKLRRVWPNAPIGLYSASINRRDIDNITFASVQSIWGKAKELGHIDLCIIDECDLISHMDTGMYRNLINDLTAINPNMRVIGLTATPWRLGHGSIIDDPAIFDDAYECGTIEQLQAQGYLAKLKSKSPTNKIDLSGVHTRGGDYIESELAKATDIADRNVEIAKEIIQRAEGRSHWLVFCAGVDHAIHMCEVFRSLGIESEYLTGETPKEEREDIISRYRAGKITALTNADVLSRGFDYPDIDLIALLRGSKSPNRYMQQVGRGFRLKSHTDHCLILDFAGLIAQHGPVTAVKVPKKGQPRDGDGVPPSKTCPECGEIVPVQATVCPDCKYEFPRQEAEKDLHLRDDDIMGHAPTELKVTSWAWAIRESKATKIPMMVVTYYGNVGDDRISEYLCVFHEGFAGKKGLQLLQEMKLRTGVSIEDDDSEYEVCYKLEKSPPPVRIEYTMDGKYSRVTKRIWSEEIEYDEEIPF